MVAVVLPRGAAAAAAGLSISTMEAEVRAGRFPKPRRTSTRRVGWLVTDIQIWAQGLPLSELPPGPAGGRKPCKTT